MRPPRRRRARAPPAPTRRKGCSENSARWSRRGRGGALNTAAATTAPPNRTRGPHDGSKGSSLRPGTTRRLRGAAGLLPARGEWSQPGEGILTGAAGERVADAAAHATSVRSPTAGQGGQRRTAQGQVLLRSPGRRDVGARFYGYPPTHAGVRASPPAHGEAAGLVVLAALRLPWVKGLAVRAMRSGALCLVAAVDSAGRGFPAVAVIVASVGRSSSAYAERSSSNGESRWLSRQAFSALASPRRQNHRPKRTA